MTRHWARTGEAGALRGMRFMVWVYNFAGRGVFSFILFFVISYFYLRRGSARRASRDYLRRVRQRYPDVLGKAPLWWLSFRQFYAFGQATLDKYLAAIGVPAPIYMHPDIERLLYVEKPADEGCLLIGEHLGNIEYSQIIAERYPDLTVNVLMHDEHARNFARLLEEKVPERSVNLIRVTDIDFDLALNLRERVQRGEWVVIAGDRVPVENSGRVARPEFLGARAAFPIGPYVLASLLQCRVYLLHCFRSNGGYHIRVEQFAERIAPDRKRRHEAYEEYAQQYATALEAQVPHAPLQWFNFYDFWGSHAEE